ncbi:MAG: uracil-DNA glycosylase [Thioploca sp.]|nr:uracil-DNA glycosylase [Thioploca sp.]
MTFSLQLNQAWQEQLASEFEQPYFKKLVTFLEQEIITQTIYPSPHHLIFNAFEQCHPKEVKVVIIGQDPYHGAGQANGLCFAVNDGVKIPPSLKNIFKEIQADLGIAIPQSGNLERWAKQGVLLLNTILTVRANQPASHRRQGWEQFTDAVIRLISAKPEPIVFLLWGKDAQQKGKMVDDNKHYLLQSAHPSPLSCKNFFGNQHFSKTNRYLQQHGKKLINW